MCKRKYIRQCAVNTLAKLKTITTIKIGRATSCVYICDVLFALYPMCVPLSWLRTAVHTILLHINAINIQSISESCWNHLSYCYWLHAYSRHLRFSSLFQHLNFKNNIIREILEFVEYNATLPEKQ